MNRREEMIEYINESARRYPKYFTPVRKENEDAPWHDLKAWHEATCMIIAHLREDAKGRVFHLEHFEVMAQYAETEFPNHEGKQNLKIDDLLTEYCDKPTWDAQNDFIKELEEKISTQRELDYLGEKDYLREPELWKSFAERRGELKVKADLIENGYIDLPY